jgi:hypothetical protein
MVEAMDVLNAFAAPLKLAWIAWLAWGVGQYFWFRHERSKPMTKAAPVATPAARRTSPSSQAATPAAHAPAAGRLSTPPHVAAHTTSAVLPTPVAPVAETQPEPTVPTPVLDAPGTATFDPTRAVIEQFGASTDNALDKFVRDFDMQEARPERRRPPVPDAGSYSVETPSAI